MITRITWAEFASRATLGCSLSPCEERADCLLDEQPLCFECAELTLDWYSAPRELRALLPVLTDR